MLQDSHQTTRSTRTFALILCIAAVSGCGGGGGGTAGSVSSAPPPSAPPPPTGGTQFTKMLVLGGSTAAGYQSSGISAATQRQAYGALLATMAGAPFAIPELAGSGCPAPVTTPLAPANSVASCARAGALPAATTGQLAAVPLTRVGEALVVATGSPYLLDATEQATMTARVDQFNSVISNIATARNWIYLDMNAFLAPLRAETAAGRNDRLRKCQQVPGFVNAAQLQNAILSSCPVTSGGTVAPNRFGSLSEFHRLLAVKLATEINAKYATTVSTTAPP